MSAARWAAIACALAALAAVSSASAQSAPDPGEIHGLKLGLTAQAMTLDGWGEIACGSNGGPARQKLETWADFNKCRPEKSGLREVAARFDDEDEYIGKAIDDPLYASQRTGTRVAGHPVILSALFDESGTLRGIRFVSDPRATPAERRVAHLLRLAVVNHYGPEGWNCVDFPPAEGETDVGGVFIKQRCEKLAPDRAISVETRFLRKPGQNAIDPRTNDYTRGQFESWTRIEMLDPKYREP
jgi:hypothetical protein